MVMSAMAYFDIDRSTRCFGMPSISSSIGTTMRDSTSSGVMPGAFMIIFTWVVETSGKASMAMFETACTPARISSSVSAAISSRCVSENETSFASMVSRRDPSAAPSAWRRRPGRRRARP